MALSEAKISVVINGQPRQIARDCTISQLLIELDLQQTAIAVEINAEIQPGGCFDTTTIREADKIEIVSLVGGG